jgi:hypothetical protein
MQKHFKVHYSTEIFYPELSCYCSTVIYESYILFYCIFISLFLNLNSERAPLIALLTCPPNLQLVVVLRPFFGFNDRATLQIDQDSLPLSLL